MSTALLFHPQMKALDAARIARTNGGRLVWRSDRQRLIEAKRLTDQAAAAVEAEDYETALQHMRTARQAIEGGMPCKA